MQPATDNVSLAPATAADLDQLFAYMQALRIDDPMPAHEFADDAAVRGAMEQLVGDQAAGRVWLIQHSNEPVGYVALTFCYILEFGGRCGFVDELYVEAANRGRGVGKAALKLAMDAARGLAVRALFLEVSHENAAAEALYRSAGFDERPYRLLNRWILSDG